MGCRQYNNQPTDRTSSSWAFNRLYAHTEGRDGTISQRRAAEDIMSRAPRRMAECTREGVRFAFPAKSSFGSRAHPLLTRPYAYAY
jgi:hypothetical protein